MQRLIYSQFKLIVLRAIVFFFTPCILFAQLPGDTIWTRLYGGSSRDGGKSVEQTADGGFIVAGHTESFGAGQTDFFAVKTDAEGDTIWTRAYGGSDWDCCLSCQQTFDGGYIFAGGTMSFGVLMEVFLVKTDAEGDTLWTRTIGGGGYDCAYDIKQTIEGGYVITGNYDSPGGYSNDVYIVKTDANGDTLWTRTYGYGSNSVEIGRSIQQTDDLGYIVAGYTAPYGAQLVNVWLLKTDANGDTLWTKQYGGPDWDGAFSVQQTTDDGYIITGFTKSFGNEYDIWLLKTDSNGDTLWTGIYGGDGWEVGNFVQQTRDGGYIVAGFSESIDVGDESVLLVKTDANGDTLWMRMYGGHGYDAALSVRQTSEGNYIVAGYYGFYSPLLGEIYLMKIKGNELPVYPYLPGDVNMALGIWPPQCIGGDVTYLVGYFIGGGQASCNLDGFWASADINGDCTIIGGDVTALVGYFVAGGSLEPCPDYEPLWPPLPDEAPAGWPNCETPVINSRVIPTGSVK